MRLSVVAGLLVLSGCFNPKLDDEPFACGMGPEPCPPGYFCDTGRDVCVREVADAGTTTCVPGPGRCDGDTLLTCPAGTLIQTPCPVGCGSPNGGAATCLTLVPTGLPPETCARSISASLTVAADQTYDTDACPGGSLLSNPARCVMTVGNITIEAGATLTVTGSRTPVLVATSKARILGKIDVAAQGIASGPGYAAAVSAGRGETADQTSSDGGGGAGYATQGGSGGANPGDAYGSADLSPILPGAQGGTGGAGCREICPLLVLSSGGAGGAAQIVGCDALELGSSAVISAGGGGGPGGHGGALQAPPGGGGGGGSGGAILLEAPKIAVGDGVAVVANGGGGGGGGAPGADFTGPEGQPGDDGSISRTPANGGAGGSAAAGKGGNGGTADGHGNGTIPGRGTSPGSGGGGGGGGAAGRIRFNARPDRPVTVSDSAIVSPTPSTGNITRR